MKESAPGRRFRRRMARREVWTTAKPAVIAAAGAAVTALAYRALKRR